MQRSLFSFRPLLVLSILLFSALAVEASPRYQRTEEKYTPPDVVLVNQDRQEVRLTELLDSDKPVLVDFIYGTCTTICPVLSAGYSNLQKRMNPQDFRLVSVSIDPEYDTPQVMTEYLARYKAKPGWDFLTGTREDIDRVMHAFDAYVQDKMSHYPLTLIRDPKSKRWIRVYGLIGTSDLMREVKAITGD